jgi:hypothetical protein
MAERGTKQGRTAIQVLIEANANSLPRATASGKEAEGCKLGRGSIVSSRYFRFSPLQCSTLVLTKSRSNRCHVCIPQTSVPRLPTPTRSSKVHSRSAAIDHPSKPITVLSSICHSDRHLLFLRSSSQRFQLKSYDTKILIPTVFPHDPPVIDDRFHRTLG